MGWKFDVGFEDVSETLCKENSNALFWLEAASILVVWVDSRKALIVDVALKQFSTRRETPDVRCVNYFAIT